MSDKPVIFISHATTDNPIVDILKVEIERVFANGVNVFASSVPGVIKPGRLWLDEIKKNLELATAVIVVVTPTSINRPWIWFEVGASWSKMEAGGRRIYPLCVPEIDFNDLPAPLNSLQALSLGKAKDIKLFFQELCDEFGFGNLKGFKTTSISARLPKYRDLKVKNEDLTQGAIYSGMYQGYSDEELSEILNEYILLQLKEVTIGKGFSAQSLHKKYEEKKDIIEALASLAPTRDNIFTGKLMHYRDVDTRLNLPPHTAKRLLEKVALHTSLVVDKRFDNCVTFKIRRTTNTSNETKQK